MNTLESLLTRLRQLLSDGMLPRSQCSGQLREQLAPLLQSGVVVEERAGAGRRLRVVAPDALRKFIQSRFPNLATEPEASAREASLAKFRDTKSLPSDTPEIVNVRAWSESALCCVSPGAENGPSRVPNPSAHAATRDYGVFSFLLGADPQLELQGRWALVENPAVFVRFERLNSGIPAVLYSRGRTSNRLLAWLAGQTYHNFHLVHFPDYDPAGLVDFQRIQDRLGERASLHVPPDLERRFQTLSNPELLRRPATRSMLAGLRTHHSPEIARVVGLIDRYNAGLEQESLLIDLLDQ